VVSAASVNVPPFPSLDVAKLPAMYWLSSVTSELDASDAVSDTVEVKNIVEVEIEVQTPLEAKPTFVSALAMFASSRG
jgi:hypothetical protein